MDLLHTLIIDTGDDTQKAAFTSLIEDNRFIVFVLFDNDAAAKSRVELADFIADDHQGTIARRVVWIQDRTFLETECKAYLDTFNGDDPSDFTYDDVLAFVISPRHHETKFIFITGDTFDDLAVSRAYWKASLRERAVA